jgi:hypothetical protein
MLKNYTGEDNIKLPRAGIIGNFPHVYYLIFIKTIWWRPDEKIEALK